MMRLRLIPKKKLALFLACLLALFSAPALLLYARLHRVGHRASGASGNGSRMQGYPRLFLWAWERPEDLDFIDPQRVGVAFLSRTIYLQGDKVIERPRMQPLKVAPATTLIAVVRIEAVRDNRPTLSASQRAETVAALTRAARAPKVSALQIDFDALESEREFYKSLLLELRPRLPQGMPLSITALASWCIYDNWLDGLPVDEAVPMLFRMGVDEGHIKSYLKEGGEFRSPLCRLSSGLSTDEPLKLASPPARTYIFHTKSWTKDSVRSALERNPE